MNWRMNVGLWLLLATMSACPALSDTSTETKNPSKPQPRQISVQSYAEYSPVFATHAKTLDPVKWSRQAWKGYMSKQPDPWGMTPDGKPTLRYNFDNRALPWPQLKHHSVDGFDNNARNVGAHALLHEMLGAEKKNDPAEAGQIAYLLGCTDPESGFAYSPDSLPRHCPLGEGEMARNVMLLYQQTGEKYLFDWAARMIETLRYYATVSDRPGVGQVAAYCQGGAGGQGGFTVGTPPVRQTSDPTIGGWQSLYVGWATGAFSKWYEITKDKNSLDFAVALANRLCNSEDPDGNDGSFRPDGSFGTANGGSAHMHSHTHCLPGLIHLGGQLIKSGQQDKGLRFIGQAKSTFDWLYDPTRNPDAGGMTGWLGEWLATAAGWPNKSDCEGCTMGDVVQTAVALGAASRLDPSLGSYVNYYDRAEQIYTGQVVEQTFRLTLAYLKVVKECLTKRVDKDMPQASFQAKALEVDKRYGQAVNTAERMVGQQLGICGVSDWVNEAKSDLDADLPGIHMQGCCADATIRASHAIWAETVTGSKKEARVNLAFNRDSDLIKVVSYLPHRGELDVMVKSARNVLVRVPDWAPKQQVKAYVQKKPVAVKWQGSYVVFAKVSKGQQLTVTYPLRIAQVKEKINGTEYTEKWRGNTIVDISPKGKYIPIFNRPELESEISL